MKPSFATAPPLLPLTSHRIVTIQLMRALACMLVLVLHLSNFSPYLANHLNGAIGVDIFFVISGYIIAASVERLPSKQTVRTFLINRFSRIAPYYYLLSLIYLIILNWVFNIHPVIAEVIKSFLFIPMKEGDPILSVGWSLNHEVFFYGFIALGLLLSSQMKHLTALFAGFLLLVHFVPLQHPFFKEVKASINIEFVYGMGIYLLRDKLALFKGWGWLVLAVSLLLGVMIHTIDFPIFERMKPLTPADSYFRDTIYFYYSSATVPRGLFYGLPSAFLFAIILAQENRFRHFKESNLALRIGNASFTIYLIQVPFLTAVSAMHSPSLLLLVALLIVIVALALQILPAEGKIANLTKRLLTVATGK